VIFKKQDIAIYDNLPENVEFFYMGQEFLIFDSHNAK
jgi:hypothetical protein